MKRTIASRAKNARWPLAADTSSYKNPADHYPANLQERRDIVTAGQPETAMETSSNRPRRKTLEDLYPGELEASLAYLLENTPSGFSTDGENPDLTQLYEDELEN
jgi:hypothetical protein